MTMSSDHICRDDPNINPPPAMRITVTPAQLGMLRELVTMHVLECGTQAKAISEGRSRDHLHTRRHEWLLAEMTAARKLSRVLAAIEEVKA